MDMHSQERENQAAELFLEFSRKKLLEQYWPRLRSAVESLTDEQVWWRPNAASNSMGNLLLHLNGNVWQWIVASFKSLEDERDRPAEFNTRQFLTRTALLERLAHTIGEAKSVLFRLTPPDLFQTYQIQGYTVTGLEAVYQVIEHFGMHYGQIVYITKMLTDRDQEFYKELATTGRSSGGKTY
jgi:hypothetical protein